MGSGRWSTSPGAKRGSSRVGGIVYKASPELSLGVAEHVGAREAVPDREIACLDGSGRRSSRSFDLLWLDGKDLREQLVVERKRLFRRLLPQRSEPVVYVDHIYHQAASANPCLLPTVPDGGERGYFMIVGF